MQPLPPTARFGDVLRRSLIVEKLRPLADVAAALGTTERGLRSKMQGAGRFSPDDVVTLLRVITDERLIRWFFADGGLLLVKLPIASSDRSNLTLLQRHMACAEQALAAIEALTEALDLAMQGERRKIALVEHLDRAQSALSSIKLHLAPPSADENLAADESMQGDFPLLVNRVLRMEQGISPQALAIGLNLTYPTLHARLAGQVPFPPAELRALFMRFPDTRLADYLLTGTTYTAMLRPKAIDVRIGDSPTRLGLRSLREVTRLLGLILQSIDVPASMTRATAEQYLGEAVRLLATMRWHMINIGHREPKPKRTASPSQLRLLSGAPGRQDRPPAPDQERWAMTHRSSATASRS
jgi:hypothetical protein